MHHPKPPQFDKRNAEGLAHSIRQFDYQAQAVHKGGQSWMIKAEARGRIHFLNNMSEYARFKCDYIYNSELSEHNAAICQILASDTSGPPDRFWMI